MTSRSLTSRSEIDFILNLMSTNLFLSADPQLLLAKCEPDDSNCNLDAMTFYVRCVIIL